MAARFRLSPAQAWRDFLYVGVAFPLGIMWLLVLGLGLALGISLALITIGIPILAVTLLLWKAGANLERRRAVLVLGREIPRPAPRAVPPGRFAGWRSRVRDRMTWRELGFMFLLRARLGGHQRRRRSASRCTPPRSPPSPRRWWRSGRRTAPRSATPPLPR